MSDEIKFPDENIQTVAVLNAPWSREITLQTVEHESGLKMMRVRIKEGRARFTIIDIDPPTARAWASTMMEWAAKSEG